MTLVLDEAKRCLKCKNARCTQACPVSTPFPEAVGLLLDGKIEDAGKLLFENNPLSAICSLICPHEKFCEGNCIRGIKSTPIKIGNVENYISDFYLNVAEPKTEDKYSGNVAIIGGGPSGMVTAMFMARYGYDVTIFENHEKVGGVMRYGIPEFRLSNSVIDRIENLMKAQNIHIRPNTLIGPMLTIDDMFNDGYDAVYMGTGVWNPKRMGIPGESLPNVHFAINYLQNPEVYDKVEHLVVVGAGNVAMDAARSARRRGVKEVTVLYRRGRENVSASNEEVEQAELDGVEFKFYSSPSKFTRDGIYYNLTEDGESREEFMHADMIIVAISQESQKNIVISDPEVKLNEYGLVETDENAMTTKPGLFSAGDVVSGAKTVVEAVYGAKIVANNMHKYIQHKNFTDIEVEPLFEI